jgi:hypothetical protein
MRVFQFFKPPGGGGFCGRYARTVVDVAHVETNQMFDVGAPHSENSQDEFCYSLENADR